MRRKPGNALKEISLRGIEMNDDNKKLKRFLIMLFNEVGEMKRFLFILLAILITFTSMNGLSASAHEIRIPEILKAEEADEDKENKAEDFPVPEAGVQFENITQESDTKKDDQQDSEDPEKEENHKIEYDDNPILGDENRLILENYSKKEIMQ
ncbi:MAG: hypothetical protein ACW980_25720 [Promethearchaeota archaeon]